MESSSWQDSFELNTVIANPLLSQRIVELIADIEKIAP